MLVIGAFWGPWCSHCWNRTRVGRSATPAADGGHPAGLLAQRPVLSSPAALPSGAPGATTPSEAAPTTPAALAAHMASMGRFEADHATWPCDAAPRRWSVRARNSAALALPATTPIDELDALSLVLRTFTTHRLALVGRARDAPAGPLHRLVAWPVVPLLLDKPPHGAVPVRVSRNGAVRRRCPPSGVHPRPEPDVTVAHIWHAGGPPPTTGLRRDRPSSPALSTTVEADPTLLSALMPRVLPMTRPDARRGHGPPFWPACISAGRVRGVRRRAAAPRNDVRSGVSGVASCSHPAGCFAARDAATAPRAL